MFPRNLTAWLFAAVLVIAAGVSCQEKVEPEIAPVLSAQVTTLDAGADNIFLSVVAGGSWSIDLSFPSGGSWASVSPSSGTGNKNSVILSYEANASEDDRVLNLTLTSAGGRSDLTLTQKGLKTVPVAGDERGYGADVTTAKWLELPGTVANDGLEWFAHDMTGGAYEGFARSGVRNYSFDWDYEGHVSRWVAYPLNGKLHGKGSYDYVWGFDPLLPASLQPDITMRSYGGVGFDGRSNWNRGHQMPRADRQTSSAAVASTCYPTNMTPQDGSFNSGIWASLESWVRNQSDKCDTLYVVTGCIQEGSTTFTLNNSGFAVRVPSAYFKAVLRYMPGSTVGFGGYRACGFYLPHDASVAGGNYMNYILSVEELEKKTGIKFFVNLPDVVGQDLASKIKSEKPVSW